MSWIRASLTSIDFVGLVSIALLVAACGTEQGRDSGQPDPNGHSTSGGTRVHGRVVGRPGSALSVGDVPIPDADLSLFAIDASGIAIDLGISAQTAADGTFAIDVPLPEGTTAVQVFATAAAGTLSQILALHGAALDLGAGLIDAESTAETAIWEEAVARGLGDPTLGLALIRARIDATMAATLLASIDDATLRLDTAETIMAGVGGFSALLESEVGGVAPGVVAAALAAADASSADVLADLEAAYDEADPMEAVAAARAEADAAIEAALAAAGVTDEAVSLATQASAQAMAAMASDLGVELRNEILEQAALIQLARVEADVDGAVVALGAAPAQIAEVQAATETLAAAIAAAGGASTDASAALEAAWAAYAESIRVVVEAELADVSPYVDLDDAFASAVAAMASARAALDALPAGGADIDATVDAAVAAIGVALDAAEAELDASTLVLLGVSSAQIEAMNTLLLTLGMIGS